MVRAPIVALTCLWLAGCGAESRAIDEAEEAVRAELRDPSSAQFRDIEYHPENGAVCGEVNAKNAYGGYVGFSEFFVMNGRAHLAPTHRDVFLDDVDQLNSALAESRFDLDRLDACLSQPLDQRLQEGN